MRIAFATTLAAHGSTVSGRVIPLAGELAKLGHEVTVLVMHSPVAPPVTNVAFEVVGREPFTRTAAGKGRLSGLGLILNMLQSAAVTARKLWRLNPAVVVIVKPMPANTLGVRLYTLIRPQTKIILDADDFELTANVLTSFSQRIAIQWSSRLAVRLARHVVVATPFLQDHFTNLGNAKKPVSLIVTGHSFNSVPAIPATSPTISYIGSLSVHSGHRVDLLPAILSEVIKTIPAARLLLAGDGDDVSRLKDAFHRAGIAGSVTWHGRFADSDLPKLLAKSQIIIDPIDASVTARAKSSFRAMLSLAAGVALVTSNIGVRSLLIPAPFHDRFFAMPAQPSDYAKKVVALLSHPLSPTEAQALRGCASLYAWPSLAKQYHSILEQI